MWVDYGGLTDPIAPPNWMYMQWGDCGDAVNVRFTATRIGETGPCFEPHHGGALPGAELFHYTCSRERDRQGLRVTDARDVVHYRAAQTSPSGGLARAI
jgi:hypothetical protein